MKIHVLPGDAQVEAFRRSSIEGELVVCRECLVENAVDAENLPEFWEKRAAFIAKNYGASREDYFADVVREFEKLQELPAEAEVMLWFEHELFCQVNLWFCLSLLQNSRATVYRVAPVVRAENDVWRGFGDLDEQALRTCYGRREKLSAADIRLGVELWRAFQRSDYRKLEELSQTSSERFPYLREVCRAEIEKNFRPKAVLTEIVEQGERNFERIFAEFSRRAGVYGFGDAQVKKILESV